MEPPASTPSSLSHPEQMPAVTRSVAKHSWTVAEDAAVSACYLAGMSMEDTVAAFPHLNPASVIAKVHNCEYLANPKTGFSHVSRQHAAIWKSMSKQNFTGNRSK